MNFLKRFWYTHFKENFKNLKHCEVPYVWTNIRDKAWDRASYVLYRNNIKPITKCKKIQIEKGIRQNPKTGQWGCPVQYPEGEFWYAGLSGSTMIQIVGTPIGLPYGKSQGIMDHEVAETILWNDKYWRNKSVSERNKFLWSLGL